MLSGRDPGGFKKRLPRDEQIEMLRFAGGPSGQRKELNRVLAPHIADHGGCAG